MGEIRELAGVDNITIAPKLLQELKDSTEPLVRKCDPTARDSRDAVVHHNVGSFRSAHERDAMASEKLTEGINGAYMRRELAIEGGFHPVLPFSIAIRYISAYS